MKLPYPDVPRYVPGGYGKWDLVKMPALRQYGYFTGPQVEPPYYMLVREGRVWMTT